MRLHHPPASNDFSHTMRRSSKDIKGINWIQANTKTLNIIKQHVVSWIKYNVIGISHNMFSLNMYIYILLYITYVHTYSNIIYYIYMFILQPSKPNSKSRMTMSVAIISGESCLALLAIRQRSPGPSFTAR